MNECNSTRKRTAAQVEGDRRQRSTTDAFIKKSKSVHGDTYDYSLVDYRGQKNKVKIICSTHGVFEQYPNNHTRGARCNQCHGAIKLTTDIFVKRAIAVHGNTYSYERADYKSANKNITITCKEHGYFNQTPSSHIGRRQGCPDCHGTKRLTNAKFIERARKIHGNEYCYKKVDYIDTYKDVTITCSIHGDFQQSPSNHLGGAGCTYCGARRKGYKLRQLEYFCEKNNGYATLYVIRCYKDNESFYKIGITSKNLKYRFRSSGDLPYEYKEVAIVEGQPDFIYNLETRLHLLLSDFSYTPKLPFGGFTECFTSIKMIEGLIKRLSTTKQLQLIA